ncbi:MAG: hypothetical protein V7637_5201, partial [Mycobacteriales bacterium]
MRPRSPIAAVGVAALAVVGWVGFAPGSAGAAGQAAAARPVAHVAHSVCQQSIGHTPGLAACAAIRLDGATPASMVNAAASALAVAGLGPADLQSAYKLPSATAGSGQTIAIVDAFDDPNAESDLATYRSNFGLPACTTANGCFRKVNQNGAASPLPASDVGWAEEISLDIDMVSAVCPNCHILLVEGTDNSFANLGAAVNRAATLRANAISNSYGGSDASDAANGAFYNHPGIAVTASSGDGGFAVEYPASSQFVVAVGGTSLTRNTSARGWGETAWSGAGSGCSRFNTAIP